MIKRSVTLILLFLLVPCFLVGQVKKVETKEKVVLTNPDYMSPVYDKSVKMHKSLLGPVGESLGLDNNFDYFTNSIMRNQIVYWHGVKFANMVRPYGTGPATTRHVVFSQRDSVTGAYSNVDAFGGSAGYPDIDVAATDPGILGTIGIVSHQPCKLALWDGVSSFIVNPFSPGLDPSFQFSGANMWLSTSGNTVAGRDQFQFFKSADGVTFTNWDSISGFNASPLFWADNGSTEAGISKSPNEKYIVYYSTSAGEVNPNGSDKKAYNGVPLDSCDQFWAIVSTNSGTSWTGKRIEADGVIGLIANYPDYAPIMENFGQVDLAVTNAGVIHAVANGYGLVFNGTRDTVTANMFPLLYYNSSADKWISVSDVNIDTIQSIIDLYPGNNLGNGYPSVSVSEDGKLVYVMWTGPQITSGKIDTASDLGTPYFWRDLYHTWSIDGGLTWKAPSVLSGDKLTSECYGHSPQLLRFDPVQQKYVADIVYLADLNTGVSIFSGGGVATNNPIMYDAFTIPDVPVGITDGNQIVRSFNLNQNYPNPFNPSTKIDYALPEKSNVSLKVFDMLGREVANLVNSTEEAGNHSVNFNASKLASGLYIYTLKAGNNLMSKKMMLLK